MASARPQPTNLATQAASSESLAQLRERYDALPAGKKSLEVNFLDLFPDRSGAERATHLLHPYPAKLIRNIPRFFFESENISGGQLRVLDPFCGSGTVLLEARLLGHAVFGADSNPLARVIASAKLSPPEPDAIRTHLDDIIKIASSAKGIIPDVVNVDYWFTERVCKQLSKLYEGILSVCGPPAINPFMWACFSACVRKVSLADPRLSVPVRINPDRAAVYGAKGAATLQKLEKLKTIDVLQQFRLIVQVNIKRVQRTEFPLDVPEPQIFDDARALELSANSIDIVITSPPYVGAQKYIRASSLSLGWLGLSPNAKLRPIERQSIGREHLDRSESLTDFQTGMPEIDKLLNQIQERNRLRARITSTYVAEMREAIKESARVLKQGGSMVLVAGPNMVAGLPFDTPRVLLRMAESAGLKLELHLVDTISSRGLMTKRNKTAGTIEQESVFLLKKEFKCH